MAVAATVATASALAGCGGLAAAYACECFDPLARGSDINLPPIPSDAPLVRCHCKSLGGRPRNLLVSLSADILLLGRRPGPADRQVLLSGAKVSAEAAVIRLEPRNGDIITLYLESAEEADQWAAELDAASTLLEQSVGAAAPDPKAAITEYQDRVKTARIAELEARVNATLSAAVQRSHRIQELEGQVEVIVEQGKEREQRIKELEMLVDQTSSDLLASHEKIKELENVIATGNYAAIKDDVATGILQDAMRFADNMLANREEEMMIDGGTASKLKESVERVQQGDKVVDREVAELISNLVTALRWPLVLRKRLANAESTVKEQKAVHDATVQQLHDLQKSRAMGDPDTKALQEKEHNSQAARLTAEAEASRLKGLLAQAERDADAAVQQQRDALSANHLEEVRNLQSLCADAREQSQAAQRQAAELRQRLEQAERGISDSNARAAAAESRTREAQSESMQLRESLTSAEQMEVEAGRLKARLEVAEAAYEERQRELFHDVGDGRPSAASGPGTPGLVAELEREQARTAELEKKLAAAVLASKMPGGGSKGGRPVSRGPGLKKNLDQQMKAAEQALGSAGGGVPKVYAPKG